MAGALDFLDTLVNRAADVAVARANGDAELARVNDQTRVPYTSPLQVDGSPLGGYLPLLIGLAVVGAAVFLLVRKR